MKQEIRTFRAATMDEALDLVRRELGNEAVVLDSKPIETRRLLPWPSTSQHFEVTAKTGEGKSASAQAHGAQNPSAMGQQKLRTLAETKSLKSKPSTLLGPVPQLPLETHDEGPLFDERLAPPPDWVPSTTVLTANPTVESTCTSKSVDGKTTVDQGAPNSIVERQQLTSLQTIVTRLERHACPSRLRDVPHEFYQQYLNLIESDIDDELARELISKLRLHPSAKSPNAIMSMLIALVERDMRCAPPIRPQPGCREVVMAVGPTGVGKTTTLAKIAGHFQLKQDLRVGFITVDTYRVGAIEQLQSYAEILQAPLRTAANPEELRSAMDDLDDVDLILIDTAGRNPWDDSKLRALRELTEVSVPDHILLVLSLTSDVAMLSKVADRFSSVSPTSLILTKLDEIPGYGRLLTVARDVPHPVSYLTTGQDVPDQIEPAHPTRLARLILSQDLLQQQSAHRSGSM